MFIARATCESDEFGITQVAICTDEETEKRYRNKNMKTLLYLSVKRPISDAIMRAAACDTIPIKFECNGVIYNLIKYSINDRERYYNKYRKNHVVGREACRPSSEIFVYSQRCRCVRCYSEYGWDSIVNICGVIPLSENKKKRIELDLQKCIRCNSYFIDGQSLAQYEEKYGLLSIRKRHITGNESNFDEGNWLYHSDSILSRNGYSTKLDDRERKRILVKMMRNGIKKAEIKDKLSEFIYFRSVRNPNASVKWQEDLSFVNEYNLETEDKVEFYI